MLNDERAVFSGLHTVDESFDMKVKRSNCSAAKIAAWLTV